MTTSEHRGGFIRLVLWRAILGFGGAMWLACSAGVLAACHASQGGPVDSKPTSDAATAVDASRCEPDVGQMEPGPYGEVCLLDAPLDLTCPYDGEASCPDLWTFLAAIDCGTATYDPYACDGGFARCGSPDGDVFEVSWGQITDAGIPYAYFDSAGTLFAEQFLGMMSQDTCCDGSWTRDLFWGEIPDVSDCTSIPVEDLPQRP